MRHVHTESHFRHALFAVQEADGYVEALLEMARDQVARRRLPDRHSRMGWRLDEQKGAVCSRAHSR